MHDQDVVVEHLPSLGVDVRADLAAGDAGLDQLLSRHHAALVDGDAVAEGHARSVTKMRGRRRTSSTPSD
jgi:hypothetical protein